MRSVISDLKERANNHKKENKKFFKRLSRVKPRELDERFHHLHAEAFQHIDCLECANCCKTTSPKFIPKDIERIAAHLKLKAADFIEQYLFIDEDDDYVLKQAPCSFLLEDNSCSIYEVRPKACREYPHTDRKKMHQILDETFHNIGICPAVFEIVAHLKKEIPG